MTDATNTNTITDVQLDPNQIFDALNTEIGVLSGQIVVSKLKLASALTQLNLIMAENASLRKRIIAQDADITAMRDQLADPNHPSRRNRKNMTPQKT